MVEYTCYKDKSPCPKLKTEIAIFNTRLLELTKKWRVMEKQLLEAGNNSGISMDIQTALRNEASGVSSCRNELLEMLGS